MQKIRKLFSIGFLVCLFILGSTPPAESLSASFSGSTIGAGDSFQALGRLEYSGITARYIVHFEIEPISLTPVSAAKIMMQGSPDNSGADNGAITTPAIAIGTTAERVANGLFYYRIGGTNYSKAAVAAGSVFSAAHTITASKFGAIKLYIDAAGAISSKVNRDTQTDALASATVLDAINAANGITPDTGTIEIGMVVIQNNGSLWTANTDDLTDASDVTKAVFYSTTSSFTEIDEYELVAGDITAQKGTFYLADSMPAKYIRIFLSTVTGEGNFVINAVLQITGGRP